MTRIVLAALTLMLAPTFGLSEERGDYHLLILSGQSNMAGMKPQLGLDGEAEKLFGAGKVVHFKVASGGKPIRLWVDSWNEIAKKNGIDPSKARAKEKKQATVFYQPILKNYAATIDKHGQPKSVTFCWMQGERDAKEGLSAAYAESMKTLIAQLRRDLKQPKMGFVIGRLSDFGKPDNKHWQKIREIQVAVAKDDPLGAWVDCDDLNNKMKNGKSHNDLHYTKEGYGVLGQRYVRQMKLLIEGKSPAENGRPE